MLLTTVGSVLMFLSVVQIKGLDFDGCSPAPRIIFSAALEKTVNLAGDQIVVYDKVYTNIGKAYNGKTGIFTAPVAGVYTFHIHLLSYLNSLASVHLYHNNEITVSAYGYTASNWATGSNTIILQLEAKDQVYVKSRNHASSIYGGIGARFATFSGYLM